MTDYSDWVLKEEFGEIVLPPTRGANGLYVFVRRNVHGNLRPHLLGPGCIPNFFEPPIKWTYYVQITSGDGALSLYECSECAATHRSKDGGDTIERIK